MRKEKKKKIERELGLIRDWQQRFGDAYEKYVGVRLTDKDCIELIEILDELEDIKVKLLFPKKKKKRTTKK